MAALEDRLVADFDDTGFCVVPSVLDAGRVAELRDAIRSEQRSHPQHYRLLGQSRDGGPIGEHGRWQSDRIMHVTEAFDGLVAHPAVLPLLRRLIGPDICLVHGYQAVVRDSPAEAPPAFGDPWPAGTAATAPWSDGSGILWQLWHREQGGRFAPRHPRCITSVQVRWQLSDTTPDSTCISVVPESVAEKKKLAWEPMLQADGTPHPELAQLTEPFIQTMWRNVAADGMHLARPGVDVCARAGDVIIINSAQPQLSYHTR